MNHFKQGFNVSNSFFKSLYMDDALRNPIGRVRSYSQMLVNGHLREVTICISTEMLFQCLEGAQKTNNATKHSWELFLCHLWILTHIPPSPPWATNLSASNCQSEEGFYKVGLSNKSFFIFISLSWIATLIYLYIHWRYNHQNFLSYCIFGR